MDPNQAAMIEAILVTILPAGFLVVLFGGGALFSRRNIRQDGEAPINRAVFYTSKYAILALWGAMVVQSWGISLSPVTVPGMLRPAALGLWGAGFLLMYIGRFRLGNSFRLGTAQESTELMTGGLFRFSRNPMYVGVFATIAASSLYTLNPVVILLGAFVVFVHHAIVLAEEKHLKSVFGKAYEEFSDRVPRYL